MTNENPTETRNSLDPSINVRSIVDQEVGRLDDLRKVETKRIDEKIDLIDGKVQIQFTAAKDAVGIASVAQEKAMAAALDGTKDALNKADTNNDKRFDALSQKIDALAEIMSKSTGAQGIYVTHSDLSSELSKLRADFETMLRPVVTAMNSSQGKSAGIDASWTRMAMIIATAATIITLLIKFIN